jgi:hypothetical protein
MEVHCGVTNPDKRARFLMTKLWGVGILLVKNKAFFPDTCLADSQTLELISSSQPDRKHLAHPALINMKTLKVPKCEIFDGSDCHDFYNIKPLRRHRVGRV